MKSSEKNNIKEDKYHYFTFGAIVPIIIASSLVFLGKNIPNNLWILNNDIHNALKALIIGGVITLISYLIKNKVIDSRDAFSKSVLLGLLAAEVLIFIDKESKNKMATITLFLYFYFHAVEKK